MSLGKLLNNETLHEQNFMLEDKILSFFVGTTTSRSTCDEIRTRITS